MARLIRTTTLLTVLAGALALTAVAAAATVRVARGSTRAALIHALVRQDGSSAGVYGAYTDGTAGIVCQRTPDAGQVRFLFARSPSGWRYRFSTRNTHTGTATQRRLEAACR